VLKNPPARRTPRFPVVLLGTCVLTAMVLAACERSGSTAVKHGPAKSAKAPSLCPPRPNESVEESGRNVPEWGARLVYCAYGPEESDAILIDVYLAATGSKPVRLAQGLVGDFIPMVKARALFACEYNSVMDAKRPLIIDLQGKQTLLPEHPGFLRTCAAVGTGEQVFLQYDQVREPDQRFATGRVFGSSGQLLAEKQFLEEGVLEFTDAGQTYSVTVSEPEEPY
jgi:hypothetical protein